MILNCEVSVCTPGQKPRFSQAKVGVGHGEKDSVFYLVVVRYTRKDNYRLSASNVKVFSQAFLFSSPNVYVMLRECHAESLAMLKRMVEKILRNIVPLPKVPPVKRISLLKPDRVSLEVNNSLQDLKKLSESKSYRTIEITSIKYRLIPNDIWNLRNLTTLKLVDCKMRTIPHQLSRLSDSLKVLVLRDNQILELPVWFCQQMHSLRFLDFSRNLLSTLPFEIHKLRCTALDFSFNFLSFVPQALFYRVFYSALNISSINFSHNCIKYLPGFSKRIVQYNDKQCQFDISHNPLNSDYLHDSRFPLPCPVPELQRLCLIRMADLFGLRRFVPLSSNQLLSPFYYQIQCQLYCCAHCGAANFANGIVWFRHIPISCLPSLIFSHSMNTLPTFTILCPTCNDLPRDNLQ